MRLSGIGMPRRSMMEWKRSRSSAASMDFTDVPRMRQPAASSPAAMLSGVCPPNCTMMPSGFSAW